jgi:hypothetical protein
MDQYTRQRKFTQRINSVVDQQKLSKTADRNTKGLLARQTYAEPKAGVGETDFTKRIANYVSVIRKQRMDVKKKQKPLATATIEGVSE